MRKAGYLRRAQVSEGRFGKGWMRVKSPTGIGVKSTLDSSALPYRT